MAIKQGDTFNVWTFLEVALNMETIVFSDKVYLSKQNLASKM